MQSDPTQQSGFYRRQAENQRTQAAASDLDRVRERCERAAAAWTAMADRAELTERSRATRS